VALPIFGPANFLPCFVMKLEMCVYHFDARLFELFGKNGDGNDNMSSWAPNKSRQNPEEVLKYLAKVHKKLGRHL
jgi:hypothetical protein